MFHLTVWFSLLSWLSAWQSYLSGSAHIANRLAFASQVTRKQLEHTTLLSTRNPPGALAKGNLSMFNWDATGAVSQVAVHVLVLGGKQDILTKLGASQFIAACAQHGILEAVDDANHMGFLERSEIYNASIASFASQRFLNADLVEDSHRDAS